MFAATLVGVAAMAQVQEAVNVYLLNGAVSSTRFEDFGKFEFDGDNLVLRDLTEAVKSYAMDDVRKVTFGDYIETMDPTGTSDLRLADIMVYQSGDECVIVSGESIRSVLMFDLTGRILYHGRQGGDVLECRVPVGDMVTGVYLITVETAHGASTQKLVIR